MWSFSGVISPALYPSSALTHLSHGWYMVGADGRPCAAFPVPPAAKVWSAVWTYFEKIGVETRLTITQLVPFDLTVTASYWFVRTMVVAPSPVSAPLKSMVTAFAELSIFLTVNSKPFDAAAGETVIAPEVASAVKTVPLSVAAMEKLAVFADTDPTRYGFRSSNHPEADL
ncbi:hypothetical protein MOR12E_28835 [Methylobacterium oryzae]